MAGAKEYELIFLLRAQMDASLKQFSVVGGQIRELEEKIQQYNNTLKDIDGYRRQQDSIGQLRQKLRDLESATADVNQKFNDATAKRKAEEQAVQQHAQAVAALKQAILDEKAAMSQEEAEMRKAGASNREITDAKKLHQAEIDRLKAKLNEENAALRKSTAVLNEAKAAENDAREAKNRHQKSIDDLRNKIGQEEEKLRQLAEALRKAGVDTKNLEAAEKALQRQLKETADEQQRFAQFSNTINNLADQFTVLKMAANGASAALRPMWDFFGDSLQAAAKLEYGMSAVEAVAGATAEETQRMTAVVKEMGATTIYTAEQSAEAMQNMALAGWDAEQMIAGLPAVIKLAAASGEDLAEMTSIVSDGMNAFQLSGERAAVKFADVLAKAATSSNTNVGLLGQSLSYVETTAGNLGYSIEDVSVALAAMANNALKGGVSGSALNTMLTRMSGANTTAAGAMEELNLSMYDANGQAKPLLQFLGELRGAFQNFGDDAQAAQIAAYQLAGMRGMRGLLAIVNQSDEQWQRLTDDVYAYAGAADRISGIRMDNYTGQMYLLTSAWDALKTSIGEQFLPTATDALEILTDITNSANEFVQNHGNVVQAVATVTGVALGLFSAVSAIATVIQGIRYAMTTLKVAQLLSVVGGFGGIAVAALAAGAAVAYFTSETYKSQTAGTRLKKELDEQTAEFNEINRKNEEAIEPYRKHREEVQGLIEDISGLEQAYNNGSISTADAKEKVAALNEALPGLGLEFDATSGKLNKTTDAMRALSNAMSEEERQARQTNLDVLNSQLEQHQQTLGDTLQAYKDFVNDPAHTHSRTGVRGNTEYYHTSAEQKSMNAYTQIMADERAAIAELTEKIEAEQAAMEAADRAEMESQGIKTLSIDQYEAITASVNNLADAYTEVYTAAYESFSKLFDLYEEVEEKETTMADLQKALESQVNYFSEYTDNLESLKQAAEEHGIDLSGVWSRLSDGSTESAAAVAAMVESIQSGDTTSLKDYIGAFEELQGKLSELSGYVAQEDGAVKEALAQAKKDIEEAVEETEAYDAARAAMDSTFDGYIDSIESGTGEVGQALAQAAARWKRTIAMSFAPTITSSTGYTYVPASAMRAFEGYAGGTANAAPGWHWVGENGPELMLMRGGEEIIPADRTRTILENTERMRTTERIQTVERPQTVDDTGTFGGTPDININFNISGDATPETVRELRDYAADVKAMVRQVIREERVDARRRAYA